MATRESKGTASLANGQLRVLRIAGLLAIGSVLVAAWGAVRVSQAQRELQLEAAAANELVQIAALDGTLTGYARMAAWGEPGEWSGAHEAAHVGAEAALQALRSIAARAGAEQAAARLGRAQERLRSWEREALGRALRGERSTALEILSSDEYHAAKAELAQSLEAISRAVGERLSGRFAAGHGVLVLGLLGGPLAAAGIAWYLLLISAPRSRAGGQHGPRALAAEQAARAQAEAGERRATGILGSFGDIFFTLDRDCRFTYVNAHAEQHFGRPRDELIGLPLFDLFPPNSATGFQRELLASLHTGLPVELDIRSPLVRDEWYSVRIYPNPDGVSVTKRNVTARKEMEAALRESELRFRQLAASVREVFWMATPDFRQLLYVSPACQDVFGLSPERLYPDPKAFFEVVEPEDRLLLREALREVRNRVVEIEFRLVGGDPPRWIRARGVPVHDERGTVYRIAGTAEEISERKQANLELRRAQLESERANRAKSEFLSRMSHELRTPMNAILGFGQLLEMSSLSEADRESVVQILRAGRHLLDLINEVLDLSKIEAGRLTLSLEPVFVPDLVQQAVSLLAIGASQRGIKIEHGRSAECACWVLADLQRLKQVLLNLLSNAIKYGRVGGSVTVRCEATEAGSLRLVVEDTGFGIAADKLERVFTPFDRLGAEHLGIEGTGLGLPLSRGLVEAMGGRLEVESVEGEGSTFWVELPLVAEPEERPQAVPVGSEPAPEHAARPRTALYVEDNLSNLRLVERIFARRPNVNLLVAMQGGLGLELAREHRPDIILLDLNLPDLPGAEVLDRLQQHPELRGTPVLIISADATPGQVERLLSRGARRYLTKPLDVRELLRAIDQILAEEPGDGRA